MQTEYLVSRSSGSWRAAEPQTDAATGCSHLIRRQDPASCLVLSATQRHDIASLSCPAIVLLRRLLSLFRRRPARAIRPHIWVWPVTVRIRRRRNIPGCGRNIIVLRRMNIHGGQAIPVSVRERRHRRYERPYSGNGWRIPRPVVEPGRVRIHVHRLHSIRTHQSHGENRRDHRVSK